MRPGSIFGIVVILLLVAALAAPAPRRRRTSRPRRPPDSKRVPAVTIAPAGGRVSLELAGSYPELRVGGEPFFVHSAAFFYSRLPRDLWQPSLASLKALGINTIDLYIPWNWHEPRPGGLDFDGSTNPRRDLVGLLRTIEALGFKIIARPGPVILNEWRNGGYPDWLLARPEYDMSPQDRLEGRYPPLSNLSPGNSEEAATRWLANATHLRETERWFRALIGGPLAPYLATRSGTLVLLQLDDDQAINRQNYNGPRFWEYLERLKAFAKSAGADVPIYINPTDMRVSAAGAPHDIAALGQWYYNAGEPSLGGGDIATLKFYTETLKTQPRVPPMIIEFQAGWYGGGDDTYAKLTDPTNTLLASRSMFQFGLRGLNYFPVQDTLYPAGYEVPWANYYYTWESAFSLTGRERGRAEGVRRNGDLVRGLGRALAATHQSADAGFVYPISTYDQRALTRDQVTAISQQAIALEQALFRAGLTVEFLDPIYQPIEQLERHRTLILPTPQTGDGALAMAPEAEALLERYVRRGGTLVVTPEAPATGTLRSILPEGAGAPPRHVGAGQTVVVPAAFQPSELLASLRITPRVTLGESRALPETGPTLFGTLELANSVNETFDRRRGAGYGFLALTNLGRQTVSTGPIRIADPRSSDYARAIALTLPSVDVPGRNALMLPIRLPLNHPLIGGVEALPGEVAYATAELVAVAGSRTAARLDFYAPSPAEVLLRLPAALRTVRVDEVTVAPEAGPEAGLYRVRIPAGVPPFYRRVVRLEVGSSGPEVNIEVGSAATPGGAAPVSVVVVNHRRTALRGRVTLEASAGITVDPGAFPVAILPGERATFGFKAGVPAGEVPGDSVDVWARFEGTSAAAVSERAGISVALPLRATIEPRTLFPIRPDVALAVEPSIIDMAAPGERTFELAIENPGRAATTRELRVEADGLDVDAPRQVRVSGLGAVRVPIRVRAPAGSRTGKMALVLAPNGSGNSSATGAGAPDWRGEVLVVALGSGEAIAYTLDVDRDGFTDYVLENERLRCLVFPEAGARSFALSRKATGFNAFTSVGGMRDGFSVIEPAGPNPARRRGLAGLFDRAYRARIVQASGTTASLELSVEAPDVQPAGVEVTRRLSLDGGQDALVNEIAVTPAGIGGDQGYRAASSVAFAGAATSADEAGSTIDRFTVFAKGATQEYPFQANSTVTLDPGTEPWIAASRAAGAETFGLIWSPSALRAADIEMKRYSTSLVLTFPPFAAANQPWRSTLVYVLTEGGPAAVAAEYRRRFPAGTPAPP